MKLKIINIHVGSPSKEITKLNKYKLLLKELIRIWGMLAGEKKDICTTIIPDVIHNINNKKDVVNLVFFIAATF